MSISKNQRIGLLAFASIALSIAIYALFFRGSDEEKIRAQLARLAHAVEVDPNQPENPIARLGRIRSEFRDLFADDVIIEFSEANLPSRDRIALADFAAQAPLLFSAASIEFTQVHLALDAKDSVDVVAVVRLHGIRAGGSGAAQIDERRISLQFKRPKGDFQIARITVEPPQTNSDDSSH